MRIASYAVGLDMRRSVLVKRNAVNYKDNKFNSAKSVVDMMNSLYDLNSMAEEHVYLLAMNTKCYIIAAFLLSKGSVNASIIEPRGVFTRLCLCGANNFILLHNHPSGDSTPSNDDFNATNKLKECADLMGMKFLDHLVVGDRYYSFAEHGYL